MVIKAIEEKNSGKKYVGSIEFESQILDRMNSVPILKEGGQSKQIKKDKPVEQKQKQERKKKEKKATV